MEPRRYYEIREKDVLKFGHSTRDYVLLLEDSAENENDRELDKVGDDGKTGEEILDEFLDKQVEKVRRKSK